MTFRNLGGEGIAPQLPPAAAWAISRLVSSPSPHHHHTRPLDPLAAAIVVVLCLSWGVNQVSVKLAIHDIPPLIAGRDPLVRRDAVRCRLGLARGQALFERDGTLAAGLACGALFGAEFILIYQGLVFTTATRAVLFIYLAPFFVVLGARIFLPADRFRLPQWAGSRAVLRRNAGRVRRADAGARSAPDHRRRDDGGCRDVLGGDHVADQGEPAQPRSRPRR